LRLAGPDGLIDTADDLGQETVILPGKDEQLGTADDDCDAQRVHTRTADSRYPANLRLITVIITYQQGPPCARTADLVYSNFA
jgi:hypothetical protein